MNDVTPRGMLKMFRRDSQMFMNEQAKMFLAMPAAERMELLFYMSLHTNAMMQQLHAQIDPDAAKITGMPGESGAN